MGKTNWLALLTACLVLTTACTPPAPQSPNSGVTPPPPPAPQSPGSTVSVPPPNSDVTSASDDTVYSIWLNGTTLEFDANGTLLTATDTEQSNALLPIEDVLTGEPAYQQHTKVEKTDEKNEYGNPVLRRTTALYDLDGKLLYDYGPYSYGSAMGELLVRMEQRAYRWVSIDDVPPDYYSELWNSATNQTVLPNVYELAPLNDQKTELLATNVFGSVVGVMDGGGKLLRGFGGKTNYYSARVWNGMVIVSTQDPLDWDTTGEWLVLNAELQPATASRYQSLSTITANGKPYLEIGDKEGRRGILDTALQVVFSTSAGDMMLASFDGELVITAHRIKGDDGYRSEQQLVRLDGTPLTDLYDKIEPFGKNGWQTNTKPERFAAQRGEQVDILDRQGKVVTSRKIPWLYSLQSLSPDLLMFTVDDGERGSHRYSCGLLDSSLNILLEPQKYHNFYLTNGLLQARYTDRNETFSRTDVFTADLQPVTTGLSEIGTIGSDRFAVVRGFSAGVMDFSGNWVGSPTSIFAFSTEETIGEEDYW